ncbi:MAG: phenylpyruvate tautomerase MIF-related protein [Polyangiaceae bacterium]
MNQLEETVPLINVVSSAPTPDADRVDTLLLALSKTLARELGKPESYVMTCLQPPTSMTFAGTVLPACYAEVKNIGELTPSTTARLSKALCGLLSEGLNVDKARIYIEFSDVKPHLFGFNGETFA